MFDRLDRIQRRLYGAFLVNFMLFGVTLTLVGATLPRIIRSFQWGYTVSGVVLAAGAVGYFTASLAAGFLVQRFGAKRVFLAGLVLEATGLLLFARVPSPAFNLAMNLVIGLGHGCSEVVTNYSVIGMESRGESRLMNLMHAAFCVGAVGGPVGAGLFLALVTRWRLLYALVGMVVAVVAAVFSFFRFPTRHRWAEQSAQASPEEMNAATGTASTPRPVVGGVLAVLTVMLFLYVSAEIGTSSWISEYSVRRLGLEASQGAFLLSLMWFGVLVGRLGFSLWYHGNRQDLMIFLISLLATASMGGLIVSHHPAAVAVFVFLTGVGFSAVYPMVMSLVGDHCEGSAAVGIAATGGGVGSFAFPFLMGFVGERAGLQAAFVLCVAASLALAVLAAVLMARLREQRLSSAGGGR